MSLFSLLFAKQYSILSYLPEAVLVIDDTGKIYYANRQAFKLFETPKLKGKNINEYFIVSSDNIINNKEDGLKQILKLVSEQQNTKITDVKSVDVSSKNKKRYILSIIDNTQDHSLLDRLISERQEQKILNRTKNVLLSKLSNYLLSPLHSITGFSQAMLEGLSGQINEKQTKYLSIINENSSELLLLIEKLIELSRIESDIYKFEYAAFDVSALLSSLVNEIKVKVKNKDIKITVNTSDLLKQNCYSDKNAVKMIIENIILNAAELMETGAININISNPQADILTAQGIESNDDANQKSHLMFEAACKGLDASIYGSSDIFDAYIQVDKNSKKFVIQSILLDSAKKYTEKLKGCIKICNQYTNQVSFIVILPVDKAIIEEDKAE